MRVVGFRSRFYPKSTDLESETPSVNRYSVWLSMDVYGELKKAFFSSLQLISQTEENLDEHEIACVMIEIRYIQVHFACASEMYSD